ncbi:MAG: tetratricopeptide repeat-containing glycosyltransferase family 2 protein [Planctomycetota bacterium]|jgi:glycosyltransferase involved in cell wall biosynthesis
MSTKEINLNPEIRNPKSNSNPTLSLCMIVKDEEKFLPTCLESIKDHVDEIIIVDTGSTDRTVEVATKYNAKIYHHPWENSFSKARNYSLSYATCDWVLILDADEEVEKEDACRLREVIRDNEVNVIKLPVFYKPKGGKNLSVSCSERIFKNYMGIHYEGIVHNQLIYSGIDKNVNIKLNHYGYHQGEEQMKKKFKRTSTLLKEQIKDDPENPIPHHYLAISCLDRKKNDECIKEALEAIRLFEAQKSNSQFRFLSYYTVCVAYYRKSDLTNAEKYALKAIEYYPDYLDAHCILTSIYFLRKEYYKCEKATENYLRLLEAIETDPSKSLSIPYNTLNHAWLAHTRMAINHYEQSNENYGNQSLNNAIHCADNVCDPYFAIGKHFMEHNNLMMAVRFLKDGLKNDPKNREIQYYLADTYEKSGSSDKALKLYRSILDDYEDEIPAEYRIGLLHLKHNRFEEAINSLKSVINKDAKHIEALFNLAIAYERIKSIAQAKDTYNNILTTKPEYPEVYIRLGNLYLNESDYNKAKECFLNSIKFDKYLLESHLALSRIYISLDDLESCVICCDQILKCLNLPRDITINNVSDLSVLYINIGKTLLKHQKENLSGFSFEIALLLDPNAHKKDSLLQDIS